MSEGFAQWASVEIMGHRQVWGFVTEVQIAGAGFLQVSIPDAADGWNGAQVYHPNAIFCITPVTEAVCRQRQNPTRQPMLPEPWDDDPTEDEDRGDDEPPTDRFDPTTVVYTAPFGTEPPNEAFDLAAAVHEALGTEVRELRVDQVLEPLHGGTLNAEYTIEDSHVEQHEGRDVLVIDKARLESVNWNEARVEDQDEEP